MTSFKGLAPSLNRIVAGGKSPEKTQGDSELLGVEISIAKRKLSVGSVSAAEQANRLLRIDLGIIPR